MKGVSAAFKARRHSKQYPIVANGSSRPRAILVNSQVVLSVLEAHWTSLTERTGKKMKIPLPNVPYT